MIFGQITSNCRECISVVKNQNIHKMNQENNRRAFPMGLLIETKLIWTQLIGVNKLRAN